MSSIEKYARAAAKTIVAQLLIAQGIEDAQSSTIEILSDLLTRYIVELGNQSHMVAELSHRIDSTPLDVVSNFTYETHHECYFSLLPI